MNNIKFSKIGHQHLQLCNPIGNAKVDKIISLLNLDPQAKVVDFGAGKCELLVRVIEKFGVKGIAVELPGGLIEEAERTLVSRAPRDYLEIHLKPAREFVDTLDDRLDVGICVGSTHAFGGYTSALAALKKIVRPGGLILIGEGYWKKKPDPEYLEFLRSSEDELNSHLGNLREAENLGLIPLWSSTTNEDEWDTYEWTYSMSLENYVFENPGDPDSQEILKRIRAWRNAYLKWGRATLGFGLYLFRLP